MYRLFINQNHHLCFHFYIFTGEQVEFEIFKDPDGLFLYMPIIVPH